MDVARGVVQSGCKATMEDSSTMFLLFDYQSRSFSRALLCEASMLRSLGPIECEMVEIRVVEVVE